MSIKVCLFNTLGIYIEVFEEYSERVLYTTNTYILFPW